jgi:hypothetical protein
MPMMFNTQAKQIIRKDWAKPILAYLHDILGKKLIYLGLPDTEAHDVTEWLEYIDRVYAFQCREYPKPSHANQSREKVLALENTLRTFERKQQISTYDVYDGYIEEVVLRGYDNTPDVKEFFLEDVVTVYNLDFCGQVSSPIEYTDREGNKQQAYKFDAIKRLMSVQADLPFLSKKFVLFLTLHCSYDGKEFENFQRNPPNQDINAYIQPTFSMTKGNKAPYWVKAFVYHNLTQFFTINHFIPEFLPVIHYKGDNNSPLMFFTVIGTQIPGSSGVATPLQKISDVLYGKFVSVNEENILVNNEELTVHAEKCKDWGLINSLHLFKESTTYKRHWKT